MLLFFCFFLNTNKPRILNSQSVVQKPRKTKKFELEVSLNKKNPSFWGRKYLSSFILSIHNPPPPSLFMFCPRGLFLLSNPAFYLDNFSHPRGGCLQVFGSRDCSYDVGKSPALVLFSLTSFLINPNVLSNTKRSYWRTQNMQGKSKPPKYFPRIKEQTNSENAKAYLRRMS